LDVRQAGGHRVGDHLHLAGDDGGQHRRGAAVRHVQDVDAGFELEQLHQQVRRNTKALRAPAELAGIGLGVGHHLGQRFRRHVGVH